MSDKLEILNKEKLIDTGGYMISSENNTQYLLQL